MCIKCLIHEGAFLSKGPCMHGTFARNTALCINDLIHATAATLPAAQLMSSRCGKLPSKLGNRIGGHMNSNHNSAYASNVVIDLEFTPAGNAGRAYRLTDEVIEIGAVKVSPEGRVTGEFSQLVKPTLAKGVGGFVHHLTGIGDEDLVQARPLAEVLPAFLAWAGPGARMVTWSQTDRFQLTQECAAKGLDAGELPRRWLDIQRIYPRLIGISRRAVKLEEAVSWCGIPFEASRAHRALYDAQMTAELFRMMLAGDLAAQHEAITSQVKSPSDEKPLSSSLGGACGGLADLLASLRAQELACA